MSTELHTRIETILLDLLRGEGFERHAAMRIARQASAGILPSIIEPTPEMCAAADEACVGMPGADDYWRAMVRQAAAAVPSRVEPKLGDLFTAEATS